MRNTRRMFLCFGVKEVAMEDEGWMTASANSQLSTSLSSSSSSSSSPSSSSSTRDSRHNIIVLKEEKNDDELISMPEVIVPQQDDNKKKKKKLSRRFLAKIVRSPFFVKSLQEKRRRREKAVVDVPNDCPTSECDKKRMAAVVAARSLLSSTSSSSSSSSSSSTSTKQQMLTPNKKMPSQLMGEEQAADLCKNRPHSNGRNLRYFTGVGLLLTSLLVLLVWGRVCAILTTSTCLFLGQYLKGTAALVSSPETSFTPNVAVKGEAKEGEMERKKRIVREGFLERNRKKF